MERPTHSPLGASGAERWMNCSGSVALLKTLELLESDEPDYRTLGTAAHLVAGLCLENGLDAWEEVGNPYNGHVVEINMADAVQVYLDTVRPLMTQASKVMIEYGISHPAHPLFYGTVDAAMIIEDLLDVTDYKHGEGIIVEVEHNPQVMYYAYGILLEHPEVRRVRLRIVQPRGFHPEGPVREWTVSAEDICHWAETELIPAMNRAEMDDALNAGPWCRFCPAKLVCPLMTSLFGAACTSNPKNVVNLSDDSLGRSYQYAQAVKFYLKAMEEETYRRLNLGQTVPGTKLVPKKANRVWKAGADTLFKQHFGSEATTDPEIKSPAEMEKLGGKAKALVHEWAYTPQTGLTVALDTDKRPGVKILTTQEVFGATVAALELQH